MKKTILTLAISSILSANAYADINDILITEYVEGSGDNKAIEITNTGTSNYTFPANIALVSSVGNYNNTIYNAEGSNILTGTTLAAGKSVVIFNPKAGDDLKAVIEPDEIAALATGTFEEVAHSSLSFNGNDAVGLVDTATDTVLDLVGVEGAYETQDMTLRRQLTDEAGTIPSQNAVYNASEWLKEPKDTFSGLDSPELAPFQKLFSCEGQTLTTIATIQGAGNTSELVDQVVYVEGIVTQTASVPQAGLYLQDITADGLVSTSDGIFVKGISGALVGQTICLRATVAEDYGQTQLNSDSEWAVTDENSSVPAATDIEMIPEDKGSFKATLERYEGMLVNLPTDIDTETEDNQDMRVTKAFGFDYGSFRNNMILSYKRPNMVPTQNNVAGSEEATAAHEQNNDYRLIIESSEKAANGEIPYYPTFADDPAKNYVRINDSVVGMEGVIAYSYGDFSLVVTNNVNTDNFKHNDDRLAAPDLSIETEDNEFAITIGSMNVLNFFNSPFGGDVNTHGENRGAEEDADFQKQKAKIVSAITGLNADVLGLMEIENNGYGAGSAIKELVDAVNANYYDEDPKDVGKSNSTSNRYVFVGYDSNGDLVLDELDSIGGDAISTGLLYRPTKVSIESMKVIPMPSQKSSATVNDNNVVVRDRNGEALESGNNYQRDTLAATFKVNQTGETLTVAVNHLKSKGSTCPEDWDGVEFGEEVTWTKDAPDLDFQGQCEHFRVSAAVQLGTELRKIGGDQVVVGDMNAYAHEDPLLVLTENKTGKALTTARDTFIGKKPQFNLDGTPIAVTKSFGYINSALLKDEEKGRLSWSYSFNDEIGTLDHALISPSLKNRLIDAVDWHINAAESSLYDYQSQYKGDNPDTFYVDDAYRSSDHDSAIISLSYKYGESTENRPVHLVISSGAVKVPYTIPSSEGTLAGDIAKISLSSEEDMSKVVLPTIRLTEDGQSLVNIEVFGINAGTYTAKMTLVRDGKEMPEFAQSMKFNSAKANSTTPKVTPPAAYDGSGGGSFGLFGIFSLLGLGFIRRRKNA